MMRMGIRFFLFFVTIATSNSGTDVTINLKSGGHMRSALVHLPSRAGTVPLVINFHTLAETPEQEESLTGMDAIADAENFVVVYPEGLLKGNVENWLPLGIGKSWNGGTCCPKASAAKVDDVQFARDLVSFMLTNLTSVTAGKFSIDPTRVYGCGGSNGGFMINRIGCEAPDLFAAIAPVAGIIGNGIAVVWGYDSYKCPPPPKPLPVLHFHGLLDPLVTWAGNPLLGFPSVPTYIRTRKGLAGVPPSDKGTVTFSKGSVKCTAYGNAASNFTFCEHHGGHCWPGSKTQGPCTNDIDASSEIWSFFKRYRKPTSSESYGNSSSNHVITKIHV